MTALSERETINMARKLTIVFVMLAAVPPSFAQTRTWTDNTGKFTIEAEFVDVADAGVRLRKTDASLIVVPLERLSEADRRHVQSLAAKPAGTTVATPKPEAAIGKTATKGRRRTAPVKASREAIERALRQRAGLRQGETSLADMVRQLSAEHQIPILLHDRGLADIGIRTDTPIQVGDQDLTLEEALNASLKPLGLSWMVSRDVLLITTREVGEGSLETVVYKLLRPVAVDMLRREMQAKIEPASWDRTGGPGSCAAWPGAVVIAQTSAVHRQIVTQYAGVLGKIDPGEAKTATGRTAKPLARLTAPVTCEYVKMPLDQVVADLAKQSGVALTLDTEAMAAVGVKADTPVTFTLQGASLESTLKWLLGQQGLTWVPDRTGVKVTTPGAAGAALQTVTYDVRDLLMVTGGNGDALVDLIGDVIAPQAWRQVGGPGSMAPAAGGLQIQQTYYVHEQIEKLLAGLRQAMRP